MLGGMAAAGVVNTLFPGPLAVTTTLSGGTNKAQGVFIEMFLTAQLVFTIFMLAAEKHRGTFIAPVGIGLALFITHLTGEYLNGRVSKIVKADENANDRCLFHRRRRQPNEGIRPRGRHSHVPQLPLDLLAWTVHGRAPCLGPLPIYEDHGVRDC